jgi:hypothetical protein
MCCQSYASACIEQIARNISSQLYSYNTYLVVAGHHGVRLERFERLRFYRVSVRQSKRLSSQIVGLALIDPNLSFHQSCIEEIRA